MSHSHQIQFIKWYVIVCNSPSISSNFVSPLLITCELSDSPLMSPISTLADLFFFFNLSFLMAASNFTNTMTTGCVWEDSMWMKPW